MKDMYPNFDAYCIDFHKADHSAEKVIINGWDCTLLCPKTIEVVTRYDSVPSLLTAIAERAEYLSKYNMYQLDGVRFDLGSTFNLKHPDGTKESVIHVESSRYPGNFLITPLRRVDSKKSEDRATIPSEEEKEMEKVRKNSDARLRANAKYDATHTKQYKFKFNTETDADIIELLDSLANKQGFIKELIRANMKENSNE